MPNGGQERRLRQHPHQHTDGTRPALQGDHSAHFFGFSLKVPFWYPQKRYENIAKKRGILPMRGLTLSIRRLLTRSAAGLLMLLGMAGGASFVPAVAVAASAGAMTPAIGAHPQYQIIGSANPDVTFGCQLTTPAGCYGPAQIRAAYNIQPLLDAGITGAGRTIVIIDAFQSPTIQSDLHTFDTLFGLPDPTLNIIAPDGLTPFDPNDDNMVGWSGEITLDVEWSHAVAPGATIDLVLAKSNDDEDILSATKYAIEHNLGDTISQSFGENESCVPKDVLTKEHALFALAALKGMTVFASSGDWGAAQLTCDGSTYTLAASSPASDPLVTAVGGTLLDADGLTGAYHSETAWNEPQIEVGTGGGFSVLYPRPAYQIGSTGKHAGRGVPDVAYNAGVFTGVLTVWTAFGGTFVFRFGGTSAGSPQWAGIAALADQKAHHRVGFVNPALYLLSHTKEYAKDFHDITTGNNTFVGEGGNGITVTVNGFNAAQGWDPTTGLGTPNVANLLSLLCH
jgi:subtilase family serine protease